MRKLGGPQYLPPGQNVPGAQFSYRPSARSAAAGSLYGDDAPSMGEGAMSGAMTGMQAGSLGGPIGAAIGTAVGALGGAVGSQLQQDQDPNSWQYALGDFLQGRGTAAEVVKSGMSQFGKKDNKQANEQFPNTDHPNGYMGLPVKKG